MRNFLIIIVSLILLTTLYNIWDNNRVTVVREEIAINDLPSQFEGFRILLLSDLHSKRFGDGQKNILRLINQLEYDIIVVAGDMQDETQDIEPLIELIRGVGARAPIYYVSGNTGPFDNNFKNGDVTSVGKVLISEGEILLLQPLQVFRENQAIWLVPIHSYNNTNRLINLAEYGINNPYRGKNSEYYDRMLAFNTQKKLTFENIKPEEVMICVSHYPLPPQELDEPADNPPYDLVLAGHYHGGQIRLPFIGAIYIPFGDSRYDGLFPNEDHVSGLYQGKITQQYISRGLGASALIPWLKFRLFNTPEVNLLTLTQSENSD